MALVIRHGGESHTMRPDRVYRTSVLAPMMNYSPQADVQAVAQAFTQGPPLATMLQGLRGLRDGDLSAWDKFKLWLKGISPAGLVAAVNNAAAVESMNNPSPPPGPQQQAASQVAPQMQSQMMMLMRLSTSGMQPGVQRAGRSLSKRRYFSYYRAG